MSAEESEKAKRRTGIQRLVDAFVSHGVEQIFGITGTDVYTIFNEVHERGIRVVDVRHECTATYAAKAVGRLTGRPGIVVVTSGPGATNTISGAMEAKLDEVPLIIIAGATATFERGTGALHDVNTPALMRPSCKRAFYVKHENHVIPTFKKAFQIAMSDVPGPVYIALPLNAMDSAYKSKYIEVRTDADVVDADADVDADEVESDIDSEDRNIFGGDSQDLTPLPVTYPQAKPFEIAISAEIIQSAKSPMIVIGSQAMLCPERVDKLRPALESMGIPCFLNFNAKGILGRTNKLLIQCDVKACLAKADVVIMAGMPADLFFHYGIDLPKNGKIITVGRNEKTLTLNVPKFWNATQVVHGDVNRYLVGLSKVLAKTPFKTDEAWVQTCQKISSKKEAYFKQKANETNKEGHLNPLKIIYALDKVAPDNVILTMDIGDFGNISRTLLRPPAPFSFLFGGIWANCGDGIGVAIGAKTIHPEKEVWLVSGDGAIGFYIADIYTCVHRRIPISILVGNDAAWREIVRKGLLEFGQSVGGILTYADYHSVAISFGALGVKLDKSDEDKLEDELSKAQGMNRTILVNALMGTTDVREGYA